MITKLLFSVVVPTYNRNKLLIGLLNSLVSQELNYNYEIIIIDDGSEIKVEDTIAKNNISFPFLRVIRNNVARGHSFCRNIGFKLAKGEYIASTDDDCIVPKDWLKKFLFYFQQKKDKSIAAVGGSLMPEVSLNNRYMWAEYFLCSSAWLPFNKIKYVWDIPACNICYRRQIVAKYNFISKSQGMAYRDALFNRRLIKDGYNILFVPEIVVVHRGYSKDKQNFCFVQSKYAKGFKKGGYLCHGLSGFIIKKIPYLYFSFFRIVFVVVRVCKTYNSFFIKKMGMVFFLLLYGEYLRAKYMWERG